MYDAKYTKDFYNAYGAFEWSRLEASAYGRLQMIIHEEFIKRYVKPGNRVLDAGSGPGRFSISAARAGANVTVLDISDEQLDIARQKINEAGLVERRNQFIEADICDLSMFPDRHFDMVICFGGALSYVCEKRQKAAGELKRVTGQGGIILVSVMNLLGSTIAAKTENPDMATLKEPDISRPGEPALWEVLKTGDLPGFPSRRANMMHAPMHLFTASELQSLFKGCEMLEIAGSNVTIEEFSTSGETIAAEPSAWSTLVELERKINHDPGLVNSGSHIIMAARKSF